MKKSNLLFIIVFSTFVSVVTMVVCDDYVSNSRQYEEGRARRLGVGLYSKEYIQGKVATNENNSEVAKREDGDASKTRDYDVGRDDLYKRKLSSNYKNQSEKSSDGSNLNSSSVNMKKNNKKIERYDKMDLIRETDSVESYYFDNKENEQSVFKVATGDIKENLTTSDKIKLLYVSLQLGREAYKKVEEFLYADDAEDGVLKALKLLKEDLSEKEYEKVRKIAGRFIDMDAAERLY